MRDWFAPEYRCRYRCDPSAVNPLVYHTLVYCHKETESLLHRQHLVYLTFMNYTIVCLQLLPGGFSEAGRDLWISFTISGGIGLFIALVVWHFDHRFPGHTLPEILRAHTPFVVRFLILSVSALYSMFLSAVTTTQLSEFINIGFIQV